MREAASSSNQNTVLSRPRAPATGASSTGPPARPRRTASALSSPEATNHTRREARIEGRVSVTRSGGALGASYTPTTAASSSCTWGSPGNNDATCASGPIPNKHTSKDGTGPVPRAATASSREYRVAACSTASPSAPSDAGIGCTWCEGMSMWLINASHAWVSLRSRSWSGRKRSSPHHRCTADQSSPTRSETPRSFTSVLMPMPPPVSATWATPRSATALWILPTSSSATAVASSSPSERRTTSGSLTCLLHSSGHVVQVSGRVRVGLVCVQPTQFLGHGQGRAAAGQRHRLVRLPEAFQDRRPTVGTGNHHVPILGRSEEHTSELQSLGHLVCRLLLVYKIL